MPTDPPGTGPTPPPTGAATADGHEHGRARHGPARGHGGGATAPHRPTTADLAAMLGAPVPSYLATALDAGRVSVLAGPYGKTARAMRVVEEAARRGERVVVCVASERRCDCGRTAVCVGAGDGDQYLSWCCALCCAHDGGWCARVTRGG